MFYAENLGRLCGILFNKWSLDYTFEAYWSTLIFSNSLQWDNILLNLDDILFICHLNAKVKMTGRSVDPGVMIKFIVYSKGIDFQIWSAFRNLARLKMHHYLFFSGNHLIIIVDQDYHLFYRSRICDSIIKILRIAL